MKGVTGYMPDTQIQIEDESQEDQRPELGFDKGEIAPWPASTYPPAELTEKEELALKDLARKIGHVDVAARRWEVEQSWMSRLFDRGYQYLFPRRGGGWIYIPFATDYRRGKSGQAFYGNETNIYGSYGEVISSAITRDIPGVIFEPQNPSSDVDITAADGASRYARIFKRTNDLLNLHQQLAYFLRVDGRALIVTDHIKDAQRFGRCTPDAPSPVVPETSNQGPLPIAYIVRHGTTERNEDGRSRGQDPVPLSNKGQREIEQAAEYLKDKNIQLIVTSPIERALESADIISQKIGVMVQIEDRLASLDLGDMAGEDSENASEDIKEAFEDEPEVPLPGGEAPEEFTARVQEAISEWLQQAQNGPIAFVVHDSVISSIYNMLQGDEVPPSTQTEPGWVVTVTPNPDGTLTPQVAFPVTPPEESVGQQRGVPRGQEVAQAYGKLEHKVPFSAQSGELSDCLWVQLATEWDVALAKATFPEKVDKIKPGGSSAGENELDRIARINASLALEASYITGDSMVRDVTVARVWMRRAYFMECADVGIRRSLLEKFPDGACVWTAGDEFMMARNENMDDHCTLVHAFSGTGMNRMALCSKLLSPQKRLNNWMDLLDQYFVRCVPMRYAASGPLDVNAINQQGTVVGGYIPILLDNIPPGKSIQDLIWMEPFPQAQPLMGEFIRYVADDLSQQLSHALPSLFGSASNTDTVGGIAIQRDQALGTLSSPWHNIQMATANYFRQAVQLAARMRNGAIEGMGDGGEKIRVELVELKGNVLSYPEADANLPETGTQRESRFRELMQDQNNALFTKLMSSARNRIAAVKAARLEGIKDPDQDAYEKQMGEFEVLLNSGPIPNPEYIQAEQAIEESKTQIAARMGVNSRPSLQELQAITEMQQQLQSIPQLISSVPIKDSDSHTIEAECCLDKINSPEGRGLADGTEKEQAAFQNLTLHWQAHVAKIPPDTTLKDFPRGLTATVKDLPPDAAATALTAVGLETKGPDVVQNKEFSSELRKSEKIGGPTVPGTQQ